MTGRTHDLAAFTFLNIANLSQAPPHLTLATVLVSLGANFVGGLAPDLDQSSSKIWQEIPTGSFVGRLIAPLLGGHRLISHSLLGLILFGVASRYLLNVAHHVLLTDMDIVWFSFMIGVFSHLVMDTFTKEGVPWFFPLPIKLGIPPLKLLRVKTGGFVESFIVFPGLLFINGYLFYNYYPFYLQFLKHLF